MLVDITVPPGCSAGSKLTFNAGGVQLRITVPVGVLPGQVIAVQAPDPPDPPPMELSILPDGRTPNPSHSLVAKLVAERKAAAVDVVTLKEKKDIAITYWASQPRLYGTGPGTRGIASNYITNVVKGHQLTCLFYQGKLLDIGQKKIETLEGDAKLKAEMKHEANVGRFAVNIFSICSSLCIGLFWFSAFGAIRLYMDLDCGAGCNVFIWPNASALIRNDARFDPTNWEIGTEMCAPVYGSHYPEATSKTDKTQKFDLGPAYVKPFPTQYCHSKHYYCDEGSRDPLYTWGVSVDVINGVIFGKDDHHCKEDECYYIQKATYDEHLCNTEKFDTYTFIWWWLLIVSNMLQFGFQFFVNFYATDFSEKRNSPYDQQQKKDEGLAGLFKAIMVIPFGCSICLLYSSVFFILIAAIASPIFATVLFEPFFAALVIEWLLGIVPSLGSLPKFIWDRALFKKMFPGAKNLDDFATNPALEPGSTVEKMKKYEQGIIAKFIRLFSFAFGWLTRLQVIPPAPVVIQENLETAL